MRRIFLEELMLIDIENNLFRFYFIELTQSNKTLFVLKTRSGKLGNAGKFDYKEFKDYKSAYEFYKIKKNALFSEGYRKKEDVSAVLTPLFGKSKAAAQTKPKDDKVTRKEGNSCGNCSEKLSDDLYVKLKSWANGEGNWQKSNNELLINHVICIKCQKEMGVFKKKF